MQDFSEVDNAIRRFISLLSVFQTQFYLTNTALFWLLRFLFVVFSFFGRYSAKISEIAHRFPGTYHLEFYQQPYLKKELSVQIAMPRTSLKNA